MLPRPCTPLPVLSSLPPPALSGHQSHQKFCNRSIKCRRPRQSETLSHSDEFVIKKLIKRNPNRHADFLLYMVAVIVYTRAAYRGVIMAAGF